MEILKENPIKFDNYTVEVFLSQRKLKLNLDNLVENVELDVDYEEYDTNTRKGLYITQIQNSKEVVLAKPYNLSDSTRKINKNIGKTYPKGFYLTQRAQKKDVVNMTRPPISIPIGCYCSICNKTGPMGHNEDCINPTVLSLKLTVRGFVECIFSPDKEYQTKLFKLNEHTKQYIVVNFLKRFYKDSDFYENLEYSNINEYINLQKLNSDFKNTESERILEIIKEVNNLTEFVETDDDEINFDSKTIFSYETVKNVVKLNKSNRKDNFANNVSLHYACDNKSKINIRFYEEMVQFLTVPWTNDDIYKIVFDKINSMKGFNIIPVNTLIDIARTSISIFEKDVMSKELNLDVLYKYLNPIDEINGNQNRENEYIYTRDFRRENDNTVESRRFFRDDKIYEFTIKPPSSGRMTISMIEYNILNKPGYFKVSAQLLNSGVIQCTFSYANKDVKNQALIDNSLLDSQERIIEINKIGDEEEIDLLDSNLEFVKYLINEQLRAFELKTKNVRDLFLRILSSIYHNSDKNIFADSDKKKKIPALLFNTVTGFLPYLKIIAKAGYEVAFFDDKNPDWEETHGWSPENIRGYIVNADKESDQYEIITGNIEKLFIKQIDEDSTDFNVKNAYSLPLVKVEKNGKILDAYLIESYDDSKRLHSVVVKYENPRIYKFRDFRITRKFSPKGEELIEEKGSTKVAQKSQNGISMRPEPFSFYGTCPGGPEFYVDRIGNESRKDNRFYPQCIQIKEKDRSRVESEIINFLMNGLTKEEKKLGDVVSDNSALGEGVSDKYCGTFKPGTTDLSSKVRFYGDDSELHEGIIIGYEKDHGNSNDWNYVKFIIEVTYSDSDNYRGDNLDDNPDGRNIQKVYGDRFHPMHRESRDFPGLNKIFDNEEDRKEFIINCAKKLNLIKPTIPIKARTDNTVINEIEELIQKPINKCRHKSVAFTNKISIQLTKRPYVAVFIPCSSVRVLLFIKNNNEQYLIDENNKVMKVSIKFSDNVEDVLIDGYMSSSKKYYPVDLIYGGSETDYMESSESGKIFELFEILYKIEDTDGFTIQIQKRSSKYQYIGPLKNDDSIIEFIKNFRSVNKEENYDIQFIPKTGDTKYLIWKKYVLNVPIVLQLFGHENNGTKHSFKLGLPKLDSKTGEMINVKLLEHSITLPEIYEYVKLKLNLTTDGTLIDSYPYITPMKATKEEVKTFEETQKDINYLLDSFNEKTFDNSVWEIPKLKIILKYKKNEDGVLTYTNM